MDEATSGPAGRSSPRGRILAVAVLALVAAMAVAPGLVSPTEAFPCELSRSLDGPSWAHPLGIDLQGCDLLARTVVGARTSVVVAVVVIVLATLLALVVGGIGGFVGGWVDTILTRATDVVLAVPAIFGALVLLLVVERRGVLQVCVVLTLFSWPPLARVVRAAVMETRSRPYVEAARTLGASRARVLVHHVLPNSLGPLRSFLPPYAASIVAAEAVLSFVGAGLQRPTVSWGLMLTDVRDDLGTAPHLLAPGVLLTAVVVALVTLGRRTP